MNTIITDISMSFCWHNKVHLFVNIVLLIGTPLLAGRIYLFLNDAWIQVEERKVVYISENFYYWCVEASRHSRGQSRWPNYPTNPQILLILHIDRHTEAQVHLPTCKSTSCVRTVAPYLDKLMVK